MSLLAALTDLMASGVQAMGYPGIFLFMFIEGLFTPIPSEVILPFAGYLARQGVLGLPFVVLAASLGAMIGSGGAYYLGKRLGRPFVLRYGRYVLIDASDLDRAEGWFRKYGTLGVFLGMSVPGSRSIVAYPAGAARMPFVRFLLATFAGATIWNSVLVAAGWLLFDEWQRVVDTFEYIDLVAVIAILAAFGTYVYWKRRRSAGTPPGPGP